MAHRRDRGRRAAPDHLTVMGTSGLAGPGFTPGDVFDHVRPGFRGHGPIDAARGDARIHDDVCDLLTDDPDLDASWIEVAVLRGVVVLAGRVPTRTMRSRAEELAGGVSGTLEVDNRIRVRRAPEPRGR